MFGCKVFVVYGFVKGVFSFGFLGLVSVVIEKFSVYKWYYFYERRIVGYCVLVFF